MELVYFLVRFYQKGNLTSTKSSCGRHDIQHNDTQHYDTQHNGTQHKGLVYDTQHKWH